MKIADPVYRSQVIAYLRTSERLMLNRDLTEKDIHADLVLETYRPDADDLQARGQRITKEALAMLRIITRFGWVCEGSHGLKRDEWTDGGAMANDPLWVDMLGRVFKGVTGPRYNDGVWELTGRTAVRLAVVLGVSTEMRGSDVWKALDTMERLKQGTKAVDLAPPFIEADVA